MAPITRALGAVLLLLILFHIKTALVPFAVLAALAGAMMKS
jgi:hypothetical protein